MIPEGKLPKSVKMTQEYWDKFTNSTFVLKKELTEEQKQFGYLGMFDGIPVEIDNSLAVKGKHFEFQY